MCVKLNWSCGLMDKALVLGTKDCRFESCQDHLLCLCVCVCVCVCASFFERHVLTRQFGRVV